MSSHTDQDGFRLPEYVPLDLWHMYLQILRERHIETDDMKKTAVWMLSRLHGKQDLRAVMQQAINKRRVTFFPVRKTRADRQECGGNTEQADRTVCCVMGTNPPVAYAIGGCHLFIIFRID